VLNMNCLLVGYMNADGPVLCGSKRPFGITD